MKINETEPMKKLGAPQERPRSAQARPGAPRSAQGAPRERPGSAQDPAGKSDHTMRGEEQHRSIERAPHRWRMPWRILSRELGGGFGKGPDMQISRCLDIQISRYLDAYMQMSPI